MSRVFLDACVLYPPVVRGLLLGCAARGLIVPLWSARVLDEWRIAFARREGQAAGAAVQDEQLAMAARFPAALVSAAPDLEAGMTLPDPADTHVLAAAASARASALITFNLRDFPTSTLAGHGLALRHPDGLLWELASHHPKTIHVVLDTALPGCAGNDLRRALKRARLPRLGKLVGRA